ncbi:MAG: hypothetical protein PVI90_00290 [Desulfobacteraceae bacterium]|jgi:hypothetical protein
MNTAIYEKVIAGLNKSAALEQYLESHNDPEILQTKTAHDYALFTYIKEAAGLKELATKTLQHPIGRGATYGLGAAIPATAGGAYLIHRAGEESKETLEEARKKAIQAALGIGGVGAGLMALHRLTAPMNKTSSADDELLLQKLATVGFLDALLEGQEGTTLKQSAHECRMLNAEHGINLLQQLLK